MRCARLLWRMTAGLLAFGLLAALLGGSAVFAQSGSTDIDALRREYEEKKQQLADIDDALDKLDGSIEANRATAADRQAQQGYNQQKIDLLAEQVETKLQEIALQEQAVNAKKAEIVEKQQELDDSYELFCERLIAIYKMNNASMLSMLLMVDTYSDFIMMADGLQRISQNDTDLLERLEGQRLALEAEREELEGMLAELEEARADLEADLAQLEAANTALGQEISAAYRQIALDEEESRRLAEERERIDAEMEEMWKSLAASVGAYVGGALEWPVPAFNGQQYISSYYGSRLLYGRADFHTGVDIARGPQDSIHGADIVAANDGVVILVSTASASYGYGYYLIVDHGGGVRTLYGHCSGIYVSNGDAVRRGDVIAAVGNTGNSTGPHLHFELRVNNTEKVDPYPYLTGQKNLS